MFPSPHVHTDSLPHMPTDSSLSDSLTSDPCSTRGVLVTAGEPSLTHPHHQKFVVYSRCCTFLGFDKCVMTHPTQSNFIALKLPLCST